MNEIKVDSELRALIPPLTTEEKVQLESNLIAEGCRDALITWQGFLLDGHNRLEICQRLNIPYLTKEIELTDREDAKLWIIKNQFGRRNLGAFDRGSLALKMKDIIAAKARKNQGTRTDILTTLSKSDPINTRTEIAKIAGISEGTISKVETILRMGTPDQIYKLKTGAPNTSINKVFKDIKKAEKAEIDKVSLAKAQSIINTKARESLKSICDLRVCSFSELFASGIKPDAVITDPPYPKEYLHLFNGLAESCAFASIPLVAVMTGQSYLPDVMQMLCRHLKYRWTLAYLTPGGQAVQQWNAKVNASWKPVILFGESETWIGDVAKSNDNDKRFHGWGQSESGMADLVERLTKPGQLVCDPFLGGGTTAVVSLKLGRRFVGCDIDAECVNKTRARVEVAICQK